jgi:hypothetical protein
MYKVTFKYRRVTGPGTMALRAYIGTTRQDGGASGLTASTYTSKSFYFTASDTANLILQFNITGADVDTQFRVDQISIKPLTSILYTRNYALPAEATGIYFATLDGEMLVYGADPDGYFYDAEHNEIVFHPNSQPATGTNNLVVYYHKAQTPEDVVAKILADAGLYEDGPTALDAMTYTETGLVIDRVWFEAGKSGLAGIGAICERCNYRFYFAYDGTPVFIPEPAIKAAGAEDCTLREYHISKWSQFEDSGEIWNDISITGENIKQPLGTDQTLPNNYIGSAWDQTSIDAHGDKSHAISNILFQSDAVCLAMATTLLAERKDPKQYFDYTAPANAIPLEMGDTVSVTALLEFNSGIGAFYGDFYWGDGTYYGDAGNLITFRGKIRDIKLSGADVTYKIELEP